MSSATRTHAESSSRGWQPLDPNNIRQSVFAQRAKKNRHHFFSRLNSCFNPSCIMPSDTPSQDGAPAPKVDFTAAMAKVKALAARLGNSASNAPSAAAPSAPAPAKRPYEEDSYHGHDSRGDDPYGKRMAYDSGRGKDPLMEALFVSATRYIHASYLSIPCMSFLPRLWPSSPSWSWCPGFPLCSTYAQRTFSSRRDGSPW